MFESGMLERFSEPDLQVKLVGCGFATICTLYQDKVVKNVKYKICVHVKVYKIIRLHINLYAYKYVDPPPSSPEGLKLQTYHVSHKEVLLI